MPTNANTPRKASRPHAANSAAGVRKVEVWRIRLDRDDSEVRGLEALLSPDEIDRARRYRRARDRRRFIVRRGALRCVLAGSLSLAPARLRFAYSKLGKPTLTQASNADALDFSVTWSGDLALIALVHGCRIGIDVEGTLPPPDWPAVARRFLSRCEQRALAAYSPCDRGRVFLAAWTRKEAYLKGVGVGLSAGLDRVEVSVAPHESTPWLRLLDAPAIACRWQLRDVPLGPNHVATLAVEARTIHIRNRTWMHDDLRVGPPPHR